MPMVSPRPRSLLFTMLLAVPLCSCGNDDGETGASTTSDTNATATSTTTDADSGSTAAMSTDASTSTSPASTSDASSADSTTGPAGDPTYPPIDNGTCPAGTAPVMLPGAELCAPFCGSADDECPMAASGDASAACTPFAGGGGSGDPCDDATPCAANETCRLDGTCADVAFWACQLLCGAGETCPDGMACSGFGTCGYP